MSGKAAAAAAFTGSQHVGDAYWIDLGQDTADECAETPGADFMVVDHDGSWHDILSQVAQIHTVAAHRDGGKPPVLVINSMTAEWELLKDWITVRARESKNAQKLLRDDPNAEVKVSSILWDEAASRHGELMRYLATFKGVVVVIAGSRETVATDSDGRPVPHTVDYRVDAHRELTHAASVWVRMSRDEPPTLIGCRAPVSKVCPGVDRPLRFPAFNLEQLLCDELGYDLSASQPRSVTPLISDESVLAPQARNAVRQYTVTNGLDENKVLQDFYRQHGEPLKDCRDTAAILQFLADLKQHSRPVA